MKSSHPSSAPPPRRRFRDTAIASGLIAPAELDAAEVEARARACVPLDDDGVDTAMADVFVEQGRLSRFQADQLLLGRSKLTLGQYVITGQLGQGGMGQVFEAKHRLMGRMVAVKVLPRAKSTPETEAAFLREIEMLGRLDHENLVRALDAGYDGKVHFLVTEIVPGLDLRRQVSRYGPLDEVVAASVISQAARGLAFAHANGVVHRDVKPGNILVRDDGRVKVSDLGLAGSTLEATKDSTARRVVGTMDYMAPEQFRSPERAHPSADIYSLGCTLYFSLTGQVPFPGGTPHEKAKRHLKEQPASIRSLSPNVGAEFEHVVQEMMRKDPQQRPASAEAVVDMLRPWTPSEPVAMLRRAKPRRSATVGRLPSPPGGAIGGTGGLDASIRPASAGDIALEDFSEDARSRGESSFGPGQSTPGLSRASDDTELSGGSLRSAAGDLAETARRPFPIRLPTLDVAALGRVLVKFVTRSALVGFIFGLAIAILQAIFDDAWTRHGLGFLDFWSAGGMAFLGMIAVQCLAATLDADR